MKKAPHEAGPKARNKSSDKQYKRSLPVLQFSPGVVELPVENLTRRPMRPDEVRHVRQIWWNLVADGQRPVAEPNIIVIEGRRP